MIARNILARDGPSQSNLSTALLYTNKVNRHEQKRLLIIVTLLFLSVASWLPEISFGSWFEADCNCLSVSFLDVGQGDAILIETPDGKQTLVDGGPDTAVLRQLGKELGFFDRTLDLVVATHPDADHVGGLVSVFKRYQVAAILETSNGKETPAAAAYAAATKAEGAPITDADAGQIISLAEGVNLRILSPTGDESNWESNTASIVMHLEYGSTSVMLTGDAPAEIEQYLVETYLEYLQSDILKLGHHGSKTSTSQAFLDAVSPQYAIVSADVGNRYGHPHQEVMQRVFGRKTQAFHTGTDGTVTFYSDGKTVWRK